MLAVEENAVATDWMIPLYDPLFFTVNYAMAMDEQSKQMQIATKRGYDRYALYFNT